MKASGQRANNSSTKPDRGQQGGTSPGNRPYSISPGKAHISLKKKTDERRCCLLQAASGLHPAPFELSEPISLILLTKLAVYLDLFISYIFRQIKFRSN